MKIAVGEGGREEGEGGREGRKGGRKGGEGGREGGRGGREGGREGDCMNHARHTRRNNVRQSTNLHVDRPAANWTFWLTKDPQNLLGIKRENIKLQLYVCTSCSGHNL